MALDGKFRGDGTREVHFFALFLDSARRAVRLLAFLLCRRVFIKVRRKRIGEIERRLAVSNGGGPRGLSFTVDALVRMGACNRLDSAIDVRLQNCLAALSAAG